MAEPWDRDQGFAKFWKSGTDQMRRRSKSKAVVWPEWVKATKQASPEALVSALEAWRATDPDVERSGGPGLQRWLAARTYDQFTTPPDPAEISADRWEIMLGLWRDGEGWADNLGPAPDQVGCRATVEAMRAAGITPVLQLQPGSAAA